MSYWVDSFTCPYYSSNDTKNIYCENRSRVSFYSKKAAHEHICQYCASKDHGWKQCSIAQMLDHHYEEEFEDDNHKEKD